MLHELLSGLKEIRNIFVTILKKGLTLSQINDKIALVARSKDNIRQEKLIISQYSYSLDLVYYIIGKKVSRSKKVKDRDR